MITQLSEETINEYASEAQTTQQPTGTDFVQGVRVGRTIPAKWWNWLFNATTRRIFQAKNDAQNMLTELQNVVTDAGLELDATDNTQLAQAVTAKADEQIDVYVENKRGYFIKWNTVDAPEYVQNYNTQVYGTGCNNLAGSLESSYDNCAVRLAYPTGTGRLVTTFKVSVLVDGKSWTPYTEVSMTNGHAIVPSYIVHFAIHKFKGRYFLFIAGTISGSWQNGHAGDMFVSDDLKTWTSMFHIYYYHTNQAVPSNGEYPAFGWSDDALYVMSKEGESSTGHFTTKLRATYDGYTWVEIASDFLYPGATNDIIRAPHNGQQVIPYGANGFLWGCYAFDGTNFAPVVSDNDRGVSTYNPFIFSSGKVFYPSTSSSCCYIAPAAGEQAVKVQLSLTCSTDGYQTRMICNGTYVMALRISGTSTIQPLPWSAFIRYAGEVADIVLIDDSGNATSFVDPPNEDTFYKYYPFDHKGKTYCGRYMTTDLVHWELVPNLPEVTTPTGEAIQAFVYDCADKSLLGYVNYRTIQIGGTVRHECFISKNDGEVWRRTDTDNISRGRIIYDDCVWDSTANWSSASSGGFVTYNSINHVIGHTLYLR